MHVCIHTYIRNSGVNTWVKKASGYIMKDGPSVTSENPNSELSYICERHEGQ